MTKVVDYLGLKPVNFVVSHCHFPKTLSDRKDAMNTKLCNNSCLGTCNSLLDAIEQKVFDLFFLLPENYRKNGII